MKRVVIKIFGQVQGVFFRAHADKEAKMLGLKGFVQNMPHGSVEIVAEGKEEKLNQLIEYCKGGTEFAKVNRVEIKWEKASGEFEEFVIKYE